MLIPQVFWGRSRDVQKEVRKLARKLAKGEDLQSVLGTLPLYETDEIPWKDEGLYQKKTGMIFLGNIGPHSPNPNFYLDYLFLEWEMEYFNYKRKIGRRGPEPYERKLEVINFLGKFPWGGLCLLTENNAIFSYDMDYQRLQAVKAYFDLYQSLGERFCDGLGSGYFWGLYDNKLYDVLVRLGIHKERVMASQEETFQVKKWKLPNFWDLVAEIEAKHNKETP